MSYLPLPSSGAHSHDQLKHNLMPSPTSNNINDWRSQRSLYMGSNTTPQYHCQVSYSLPHLSVTPHVGSIVPFSQVTPIEQVNNLSGKILYPSSSYQYGNPGFYYDPLQFPVSTETQTSTPYVPYPNTSTTPVSPYNNMPPHGVPNTTFYPLH
jgi:hypothetical protein